MSTHGGSSFPVPDTLFRRGHRVSHSPFPGLDPRSFVLVPRSGPSSPERRTRQIKRSAPPDRRPFQAREQFADNVNSHPDIAHGDSQPVSNWSRDRNKSSNLQPFLEQFADNVNSHPTPLGHGDPHANPKYQRGRGKIPRSHRSASRVINHHTIS